MTNPVSEYEREIKRWKDMCIDLQVISSPLPRHTTLQSLTYFQEQNSKCVDLTRRQGTIAVEQRHQILRQRRAFTSMLKDCHELSQRCCGLLNNYAELIEGMKEICNEDGLQAAVEEQAELMSLVRECERYYTVAMAENAGTEAEADADDAEIDELIARTAGMMIP